MKLSLLYIAYEDKGDRFYLECAECDNIFRENSNRKDCFHECVYIRHIYSTYDIQNICSLLVPSAYTYTLKDQACIDEHS